MATPQVKLAQSLEKLKDLQDKGHTAIRTKDLSRLHRERLLEHNFIKEVIQGWYIIVATDEQKGDSTSWYASYWNFCARYLEERFNQDYCISAEQSLQIHAGNTTVPQQLIIRTIKGSNAITPLIYGTSLFSMKSTLPNRAEIEIKDNIRILNLASSLVNCTPIVFKQNSIEMRTALAMIQDSSEILEILLEGGNTKIAGRLAGAFRNIGKSRIADDIIKTMKAGSYDIREEDPFETPPPIALSIRDKSPYVNRIRLMWFTMREDVIKVFPKATGLTKNNKSYIKAVEEIYVTDAYHSLSIERYRVTPELIDRLRSGIWNPDENEDDRKQRDAMAARGYWLATQRVINSLKRVLNNKNPGLVADEEHGDWYRELFAPSVTTGLLKISDLSGYRNDRVYIGKSKYVPLNAEGVRDTMPELFELLINEEHAGVRAILGHFIFVYIHPYKDGNGRMGRFLMNVMLASGGYPWTVIPVEERNTYMNALEEASVEKDIKAFSKFISWLVEEGMKGTPVAKV